MSILLALIVWIFAIDQENPLVRQEFDQPIPVEVRGLGDDLRLLQDLNTRPVLLSLRAPLRTWDTIQSSDFTAYLDLTNLGPGPHDVEIRVDPLNPAVDVIEVQPSQLRIQIDPLASRMVPVTVDVTGTPAESYEWQLPTVEPQEVLVSGPQTLVDQVRVAYATLSVEGARSQVERSLNLSLRNGQNQVVERLTASPNSANVIVPIVQKPGQREVVIRLRVEGQPAPGYRLTNLSADPGTLILEGSPENMRNIPGFVDAAPINIENATETVQQSVELSIPEGVVPRNNIYSVQATVGIQAVESSTTVQLQPVIEGLGNNLRANVSLDQVDVIISGPLPRLNTLLASDIQVRLDLSGLSAGSHVLEPIVTLPQALRRESVIPQTIEVTLEFINTPTPQPTPSPTVATPSPPGGEQTPSPTPSITPAAGGTPGPGNVATPTPTAQP
jgi:YbbR domain-containing protein